ncbi:hypothetical protein [Nesterenkonia haasae]|nr:hypothetical protein [Nesterenkonia haasae]
MRRALAAPMTEDIEVHPPAWMPSPMTPEVPINPERARSDAVMVLE